MSTPLIPVFLRLKRDIGIKRGTLHTFRHTYATIITIKTGNIRVLQTILGHQKIETATGKCPYHKDGEKSLTFTDIFTCDE